MPLFPFLMGSFKQRHNHKQEHFNCWCGDDLLFTCQILSREFTRSSHILQPWYTGDYRATHLWDIYLRNCTRWRWYAANYFNNILQTCNMWCLTVEEQEEHIPLWSGMSMSLNINEKSCIHLLFPLWICQSIKCSIFKLKYQNNRTNVS